MEKLLLSLVLLFVLGAVPPAPDKVIRIPVVVHVVYADSLPDNGINDRVRDSGNSTMYLPKDKIEAEIADLHLDFLKLNSDTSSVLAEYKNSIGNPNIDFYLSAIKYVRAKESVLVAPKSNSQLLCTLSPIVDSKRHLNIYMSLIKTNGVFTNGVATVKTFSAAGGTHDAIFLNYKWIGLHYRLATHETGHWLGLWHPWTEDQASDGITDIPLQKRSTDVSCERCPPAVRDRMKPNATFKKSNYNNFMDYSGCRIMFSRMQAKKMRQVGADYRAELWKQ